MKHRDSVWPEREFDLHLPAAALNRPSRIEQLLPLRVAELLELRIEILERWDDSRRAQRLGDMVAGTVVASISVSIGMWLERFTIIVPTLVNPRLPWPHGIYVPSWVEIAITAAFFATFTLLYMVFTKLFPIVSIWEVREGREKGLEAVEERIRGYLPSTGAEEEGDYEVQEPLVAS